MNDSLYLDSLMPTLAPWAVTSALLILAVLAIRHLCRNRLSARTRYALWAVVLLRLLVPVQFSFLSTTGAADFVPDVPETPVYAFPTDHVEASEDYIQFVWEEHGEDPVMSTSITSRSFPALWGIGFDYYNGGTVLEADGYTDYAFFSTVPRLLSLLWIAGTMVMALVLLASNLHFYSKLRRFRQVFEIQNAILPVYITNRISAPCLFGLFKPSIYLTPETAGNETALRHVLVHEQTHYAHRDHIWSVLRCAALALHWYNPLVWAAVVLSKRDGELACDEGAVRRLGESERIAYGRTLVDMVAARSPRPSDLLSCSTAMTEGKKTIQQRITQLVKKPETKAAAIFGAAALVALAALFTFSGTKEAVDYAQLRAQIQSALSLGYSPPPYSSQAYPSIADADLLEEAKNALAPVHDLLTPVELDWADGGVQSSSTLTLTTEYGTFSYFLCTVPRDETTYVLSPARLDAKEYTPVASLDQGVTAALEELARQQLARNQSITRVEHPEFKAALTRLFLGDEECVRRNETPEGDMEEWLTQHTSFYEISHAAPWWLEGAEEGWYARAMDAGSWYTISIPDHLVPQVQAIIEGHLTDGALGSALERFRAETERAVSIRFFPPLYSSKYYPTPITDPELLTSVKEELSLFSPQDLDTVVSGWAQKLPAASRIVLSDGVTETTYALLLGADRRTYLFSSEDFEACLLYTSPILLGLNAPINDLSRGCNAQEVYSMAIITAALA